MVPSMNVFLASGTSSIFRHSAGAWVCTRFVERQDTPPVGEVVHLALGESHDVGELGRAEQQLHPGV